MAQSGFTPISIYYSTTASAVPTAANLVPGELAINTADGKLYYEDSSGVVQVLATKSTGSIGGSNTQVQFNNSGSLGGSSGLTWDGSFLTTSSIKNSALTSGRVTYAGASGLLTDNSAFVFNGNLGLGAATTSGGRLVITQDNAVQPAIYLPTDESTIQGPSANTKILMGGNLTVQSANVTTISAKNASGYIVFATGSTPTEGLRLTTSSLYTASGVNVGIGTSSPSYTLDVLNSSATTDTMRVKNSSATGYSGIWFDNNASTASASVHFNTSSNYFENWTNSDNGYRWLYAGSIATATTQMVLTGAGNLGIGTTSPTSFGGFKTLELANSSGNAISLVTGTSVIAQTIASNTNSLVYTGTRSNHSLVITTNDTERMRIDTAGIVTMNAYGAGAATFSASGVISSVSDETWKTKDGVPVNTDAMLQKLEPGYWFYNEEKAPTFGQERQLGFYAQNVHEAIGEEAAPTPQEGKPWGYHDRSVLAIAVMSLKTALNTIEELKQRILILENK
jgi:hypothetical protein